MPYVGHYEPQLLYSLSNCFIAVYNQDQLILETIYAVNKVILQKIIQSYFKSRGGYNGTYMVDKN